MKRWAISLPDDLADAMERLRRKERKEGYRRHPEGADAEAYGLIASHF